MHALPCFVGSLLLAVLALRYIPKSLHGGDLDDQIDLNVTTDEQSKEARMSRWNFVTLVCGDGIQASCPFPFTGLEEFVGVLTLF
jgi:hypothetical protein